jgi:peptidyl-prolyl cis-trans isomerase SurA
MRKKSLLMTLIVLLGALGMRGQNVVDEIIARVNNAIITRSDLEHGKQQTLEDLKQRYPSDWQSKWTERQNDVLRDLIDQQLLVQKGKELGITADTELIKRLDELRQQMGLKSMEELEEAARQQGISYEDFKDQIRNSIVTQKVIAQEVGGRIGGHITNEDVQNWYKAHQKDLEMPEQVTLAEILISTQPPKPATDDKNKDQNTQASLPEDPSRVAEAQAQANDLLQQLRNGGAKFEDLARKYSAGPTAAQGGEIGTFKRGEMARELEDKVFSLKPGEVSDVVRTRQGFIIFKVLQHQDAGIPPLKDLDAKIRDAIYVERLEPAARVYLTKLREEAFVEVHQGFVDTGASPNQTKPIIMASNTNGDDEIKTPKKQKRKKHFLVF